jgi:hypothetical protein
MKPATRLALACLLVLSACSQDGWVSSGEPRERVLCDLHGTQEIKYECAVERGTVNGASAIKVRRRSQTSVLLLVSHDGLRLSAADHTAPVRSDLIRGFFRVTDGYNTYIIPVKSRAKPD